MIIRAPRQQQIIILLGLFCSLLLGMLVPYVVPQSIEHPLRAVGVAVALSVVIGVYKVRSWTASVWHPLFGPLLYVTFALIAPVLYVAYTYEALELLLPNTLKPGTILALALTTMGFALGAIATTLHSVNRPLTSGWTLDHRAIRIFGRIMAASAAFGALGNFVINRGRAYGEGQTQFSTMTFVFGAFDGLAFVGAALIFVGNYRDGAALKRFDLIVLGTYILFSAANGVRGQGVIVVMFLLFARHHWVRRVRLSAVVLVLVVAAVLAYVVTFTRSGGTPGAALSSLNPGVLTESVLVSVSSSAWITNIIVSEVPKHVDYASGSTYLAALKRLPPGILSIQLFGTPDDTGSYVFRRIINYDDPDSGFSFAYAAEAYLNYGFVGNLVLGGLLGALFGFAWNQARREPTVPIALLYPLLVATLPLALRSDALTYLKIIAYPFLSICFVMILFRRDKRNQT